MRAVLPINRLLVVERDQFRLTLFRRPLHSFRFKIARTYPIAVGAVGRETPRGLYLINHKQRCPTWTVPESDWTNPDEWGKTLKCGDPANPIRGRWLGIYEGVGIHGIPPEEDPSIGSAASHGCIRMHVVDVIELYPQVPKWTPIYIV